MVLLLIYQTTVWTRQKPIENFWGHSISNGERKKKRMLEATAVSHTFKTSLINSLEQNTLEWAW